MISIYKLQSVSSYCLIEQVNKILGIRNSEIWLFDDVSKIKVRNSGLGIRDAMWRAGQLTVGSCDGKSLVSWIGVPILSFPLRR